MKRIVAVVSLVVCLAAGYTQAAETAATPEDCIRNFYRWYVTSVEANREPLKQRSEMKRYATDRLLKEIDKKAKSGDGLGADYFINAQDVDPLWAKNISISDVQTQGNKSTAHVVLKGGTKEMRRKLVVHLVKDGATWKVDKVEGIEGGN
ncbi:MAG TPA: DUF3828 domain-containing protein [Chthoniobacterales bacterium]|nr:DUF3828 domain-containing protein [Chthoniobacterales bacterium]